MTKIAPAVSDPVVLFDGDCGMCHRVVRHILRHERGPELKFAPLDSDFARALLAAHGLDAPPPHTVVFSEEGRLFFRSDAALRIARRLKAPRSWLGLLTVVPRPVRDAGYDFIARRRRRWFRKPETACPAPGRETRNRFLS